MLCFAWLIIFFYQPRIWHQLKLKKKTIINDYVMQNYFIFMNNLNEFFVLKKCELYYECMKIICCTAAYNISVSWLTKKKNITKILNFFVHFYSTMFYSWWRILNTLWFCKVALKKNNFIYIDYFQPLTIYMLQSDCEIRLRAYKFQFSQFVKWPRIRL